LHQVGDLFELNVKLWCQKVNILLSTNYLNLILTSEVWNQGL